MKELSIEEKAKRYDGYDEAIERAKKWYNAPNVDKIPTFGNRVIEEVFPELRESEDDRIRKDIERAISVALDYSYFDKETANNCLAWLEKQGKISDKIVERARTEKQRILVTESDGVANIDWDTRSLQDVKLLLKYGLDYIKKLEKQGEQKLINKVEPKFKVGYIIKHKDTGETYEVSKIEAIYADEIYYHLTNGGCVCENADNFERVEQPADKVEPKFKVSDTIKYNGTEYKITEITPNGYKVYALTYDEDAASLISFSAPAILVELKPTENKDYSAHLDIEIPFGAKDSELIQETIRIPDGCYAFIKDNEIVIKKGEKHTNETLYPETLDKAIDLYYYSYGNGNGGFDNLSLDKFRDIVHTFIDDYGQKSAEWSEEDEVILSDIICSVNAYDALNGTILISLAKHEKKILWLKSLKDRILPQSNQEWKQENTGDLNDFENAMMHIGNSFFGQYAGLDPNDTNTIKEQANLLLELVPNKEWSEEDERWLDNAIVSCEQCGNTDTADWLKSLRPKNTWKPSDEQINALEYYIYSTSPTATITKGTIYGNLMVELLKQLKKLKGE